MVRGYVRGMALATYKDLCIDANDVAAAEGFWSRALLLTGEIFADDGSGVLRGESPRQTVWLNLVPEAKTVKNRVHLDVLARSLEPFAGCEQRSADGEFPWTVFLDPEGNEFCVFVSDTRPPGVKALGVDCVDHHAISTWWGEVLGSKVVHEDEDGYSSTEAPGSPFESFDFSPVPEPKTVKNRLHWDVDLVDGATVDDLVAHGATVLDLPTDDTRWTVMADPEGNEFCVFAGQ